MRKNNKSNFEKIAGAPAMALDHSLGKTAEVVNSLPDVKVLDKTKNYWKMLGPGLTTGASDDDPSGIATYSQTGAQTGFSLLWLAPLTYPLMSVVQEMCARIGIVTGRGLAGNIRIHFSRKVLYACALLLFAANAFNIGADLGAMAKGAQLLRPSLSFGWLVVGFAILCLALQIFTNYAQYARYLKWLALVLFAYIFSALMAHLPWADIVRATFTPHVNFNKEEILLICAILGTTISPYLFFWQTSQEVEEQIVDGKTTIASRQGSSKKAVKRMRIDVWSGMFLSNLVMFFIIAACGGILFPNGITSITSASQAAEALRPFAGNATFLLFAVGIIGTGLLAIPVLAGASSYAMSEAFGWKSGLYRPLRQAHSFYGVIIFSMLAGVALNFIGLNPIKALIYSAIGNGLVAPIVLVLVVLISSNKKIMGEWVNKKYITFIGWFVILLMSAAGIAAIFALF